MSGGSLDYVYNRVEDAAKQIARMSDNPLHRAFYKHLINVSKALYDLEWVLSGDRSAPEEEAAIRAVLRDGEELSSAKEDAEIALKNLERAIIRAQKTGEPFRSNVNNTEENKKITIKPNDD